MRLRNILACLCLFSDQDHEFLQLKLGNIVVVA